METIICGIMSFGMILVFGVALVAFMNYLVKD